MTDTVKFEDIDNTWVEVASDVTHDAATVQNKGRHHLDVHIGTAAPAASAASLSIPPGEERFYSGWIGKIYLRATSTRGGVLGVAGVMRS